MKILTPTRGVVAVRLPQNGYLPEIEHSNQILFNYVQGKFGFINNPQSPFPNTMVFSDGQIRLAELWAKIHMLILEPNGVYVDCSSTNVCEEVLRDLESLYDDVLRYSTRSVEKVLYYYSVIVADFEKSFEGFLSEQSKIYSLLSGYKSSTDLPHLRKIEFGWGDVSAIMPGSQIEVIARANFSIEKRVEYPVSSNVYFCTAPLSTSDHIEALEKIEKIL